MNQKLKILYVGKLFPGSTALHRCNGLQSLGHYVEAIDSDLSFGKGSLKNNKLRIFIGLRVRTNDWLDWRRVHQKLLNALKVEWDVLWIDKGVHIRPQSLRQFKREQPECKLISYLPDDMFNPANQTQRYMEGINVYDLIVTTKSYNISEFKAVGAKDVYFVQNSYDPEIHRPIQLSDSETKKWSCDVCFVGDCEAERERSIISLAETGVSIGLFGPWTHLAKSFENVTCHEGFFADDAYAKVLCAGKIGLCFLRKVNRDLQTTRSIEMPACGVFMLAERTDEHLALFEEGREAEFFSNDDELIEKVHYYLFHEQERKAIAVAGRQRCLRSGYSHSERLQEVLNYLYD